MKDNLSWEPVSYGMECIGSEQIFGHSSEMKLVHECARACEGSASMFAYGKGERCDSDGCMCLCETSAAKDGSCTQRELPDYTLYRFTSSGEYTSNMNYSFYTLIIYSKKISHFVLSLI